MADKSKAQKLKEKLFLKRKNGGEELSEEILKKTQTFAKGYKNFLNIRVLFYSDEAEFITKKN